MSNKIIRTVCVFTNDPSEETVTRLQNITEKLQSKGYVVQTQRVASTIDNIQKLSILSYLGIEYTSVGNLTLEQANTLLPTFLDNKALAFNVELAKESISLDHVALLQDIISGNASRTFGFTYTFNNAVSSPYFPSACYEKDGFAVGLQPTDLAEGCSSVEEWLEILEDVWKEIDELLKEESDYLGIDSSIAPLLEGNSSFVNFIKRLGMTFEQSVTTDLYTRITKFIKEQNPKPVGLCGMMLPCAEDFELTAEYEAGNFSIERNIFLSLHSGLGIDTYPIGIDEKPERVLEILVLLQALSNKYSKPLSARFVSDGNAKIGDKTDFQNQYLKDCTIRPL